MKRIDAHQHFWQFDPVRDAWIDDTMQVIRKDFLPKDLQPILANNSIDGCIAVQADQSETETAFLLNLAAENNCIKGVVGWVDLLAENLTERLAYFAKNPFFKGIRHIAQGEADDFLMRKDVQQGIGKLEQFRLTYDILVYAHQLPAAIDLVSQFPNQPFVLDHIAKPKISEGLSEEWKANIKKLATFPNVYCKLSGMVTETTGFQWKKSDFQPFLDIVLSEFGVNRVLYGSDWPVCLLAAKYAAQLSIVQEYIATFSTYEQTKIMGGNAIEFYNLGEITPNS
ncbi:MAG: amidohydrolase [Saprospiraceae bacterium]